MKSKSIKYNWYCYIYTIDREDNIPQLQDVNVFLKRK